MGHLAAKDVYRDLGRTIDALPTRAPWSETLGSILRLLYTEEEAELVARMPTGLASFSRIQEVSGADGTRLASLLERLAEKGLVMDIAVAGEMKYTVSPIAIGIFEYTMMRTDNAVDFPRAAALFKEYMLGAGTFFTANFSKGEKVSVMRTLPHQEALREEPHVEVLDYEKADALVDQAPGAAVGICSCRHAKLHLGEKECETPLEMCLILSSPEDYAVRHGMARPASKTEVKELLDRARDLKLVLNADNVKRDVQFICTCCACCCTVLNGIRKFGYPNAIVTSAFAAACEENACTGCGKCAAACPIEAIEMTEGAHGRRQERRPRIDAAFCLGCGVCGLACAGKAMRLVPREQAVLLPEHTIERVVLQSLERGTLQNLMFDNPHAASHKFMRSVMGTFLSLSPVKRYMMSQAFRSRFLARMA